jgi:hypothetical protein
VLSALKGNPATAPILVLVVYVGSGWETIDLDEVLSRAQRALTATDHPRVGRGMVYAAPSQPTPNAGV